MPFTWYDENTLRDLAKKLAVAPMEAVVAKAKEIIKVAQKYPPERPGQKYIRTNTFKNDWELKTTPAYAEVSNYATQRGITYPVYVMGDAEGQGQAEVHAGRWQLIRDITNKIMKTLPASIYDRLKITAPYLDDEQGTDG